MDECILGIKCNGVSISISQITIDKDQSIFDYICNVSLKNSWNGNGTYDVSIINKDYIQGMPIGKWYIKKAWITFNWGDSKAWLIMEDEEGNETCEVVADEQRGSAGGFHVPSLAKTIFTKAQEIIRDYPSAKIYNAIMELNTSKKNFNLSYYKERYDEMLTKSDEAYINFIAFLSKRVSDHLCVFKKTMELLQALDDPRSKKMLKTIMSDCRHLLDNFKVCSN